MGLFNFLGNVIAAPLKITASAAKATVKTTGHLLAGDLDGMSNDMETMVEELGQTVDDITDSIEEE